MCLLLAACGGTGSDGATTTTGDESTTTEAAVATTTTTGASADTTEDDTEGPVIGINDIPQECLDAFADFLRQIEPIVEPIDWENATASDLEDMGEAIDEMAQDYDTEISDLGCEDLNVDVDDEEAFEFMVDFARREAPGTVGYMSWIADFAGNALGTETSGDCETDIAAVQAIVDQGGTINDLPLTEVASVGQLVGSVAMVCSATRAAEFFSQPDVEAFLAENG